MTLIAALNMQRQEDGKANLSLYREFEVSQGYIVKPCFFFFLCIKKLFYNRRIGNYMKSPFSVHRYFVGTNQCLRVYL